jgi:hypothetical protein
MKVSATLLKPVVTTILAGSTLAFTASGRANAFTFDVSGTWSGTEPSGTVRLFRDGIPSVAGTAKPFPGVSSDNPTWFQTFDFSATPGTSVSVTQLTGGTSIFLALYDGSSAFSPANLAQGYLGDAGSSIDGQIFSVTAPVSGQLALVTSTRGSETVGSQWSARLDYTPTAVPGPVPLFGAAAAFGYSRKLRRRLLNNKLPNPKAID